MWARFMIDGSGIGGDDKVDWSDPDPAIMIAWQEGFRLTGTETLTGVLASYKEVAKETDRLVREIADLDESFPLPATPWNPPNSRRSIRRAILHIVAETAQHAGHADIIRERIEGSKTMG